MITTVIIHTSTGIEVVTCVAQECHTTCLGIAIGTQHTVSGMFRLKGRADLQEGGIIKEC